MTLVCRTCTRVNPPEARFCYHDGAALVGGVGQGGPIAVGAQPFLSPFVFPSGRACRNFDELVLACEAEWEAAQELLYQGYLGSFLGGLGRADLALAARQAMKGSDRDRGLDQFLNKLPSSTREPGRLAVPPLEGNLGVLSRGGERRLVLHPENQGMGLLYGSAVFDNPAWLPLGESPGAPRKVFQFRHEFSLPVNVHGKALRASNRPLEGRLVIESNGGRALLLVRAE